MTRQLVARGALVFLTLGAGCTEGGSVATVPDAGSPADVTVLADASPLADLTPAEDTRRLDIAAPGLDSGSSGPICAGGSAFCADRCVSLRSDHEHCGACGNACAAGERCEMGRCVLTCAAGTTVCQPDGGAARCADLQRDPTNCGACGNACPSDQLCAAGVCATRCLGTLTACGRVCRDLEGDARHCGQCNNACPAGQRCSQGRCVCDGSRASCMVDGSAQCVDLNTDARHCGRCDLACPSGTRCEGGRCALTCGEGLTDCFGRCVDAQVSVTNCGACGVTCQARPNRPAVCVAGSCRQGACEEPFADCDNDFANGCETNLRTSAANCGRCGLSCGTPRYGTAACVESQCTVRCATGQGDCDGDISNGCEADFSTDPRHCGGCRRACPSGQGCRGGTCVASLLTCSVQATLACLTLGGRSPSGAQDGRLVCVFGNVSTTDYCGQSCDTYRVFTWRNGANFPACASTPGVMQRGSSYTGPAFCGCDQPPRPCGTWDMGECVGN